jgi:hypothetical protein
MGQATASRLPADAAMSRSRTASCTLVRGSHHFTMTVGADDSVSIRVDSGGRNLAQGPLQIFQRSEIESVRYRLKFHRAVVKPVAQVGAVLIGPDALQALQAALIELRRELGTL